jgi:hypothetical protein
MNQRMRFPLGVVVISVIMFFVAFVTDIFWLAKLFGRPFPPAMPVDSAVYNAFAAPDIILSLFLYIGAYGLIKLRKYGFVVSLIAMGMWLFDALLVLGITKTARIDIIGPSLFFILSTIIYLWMKKDLFGMN